MQLLGPNVSLSYLGGTVRLRESENPGGFLSSGAELSTLMRAISSAASTR